MTERDIKCRRVSCRQLQLLWEYLNSHRSIAGAYNRSLAAKAYSVSKWKELAVQLNAEGEGACKDWRERSKSSITPTMGSSTQPSTASDSILRSQELLSPRITLPTSSPAHALSPPPTSTPTRARPPAAATPTNSPYCRRRRRNPPMTQEAARRVLVQSSQMRTEATVRLSSAAEMMLLKIKEKKKPTPHLS